MWKLSLTFSVLLSCMAFFIIPLGGIFQPLAEPKSMEVQGIPLPGEEPPGPFYLPFIAGSHSSWQCYPNEGTFCSMTIFSISMVSPSEGWAVGQQRGADYIAAILHFKDGSWQQVSTPPGGTLYSLTMRSSNEGWAVGKSGTVMHYFDGAWHSINSPTTGRLFAVASSAPNDVWIAGEGYEGTSRYGILLHYSNGSWLIINQGPEPLITSMKMISPSEGWAAGYLCKTDSYGVIHCNGMILHYLSGNWQMVNLPICDPLYSVDMLSPSEGWAVGYGDILHYIGGSWNLVSSFSDYVFESVAMVSEGEGWAVGYSGDPSDFTSVDLHYSNGSWQRFSVPPSTTLFSVAIATPTEAWAVGENGTILYFRDSK
jgi:hypothetical protein